MTDEQVPMFEVLPVTEPKIEEESANCLNENLPRAMNRRGIQAVDIMKGAPIAWGTLMDWIYGKGKGAKSQLTDENLLNVVTYLECTVDWLCYGIGEDDKELVKFKDHFKKESA